MTDVRFITENPLVRGEMERLSRGRWLQPDATVEALGADTLTWLGDRFDELLAALAPWSDGEPLPTSLALRTTRSMHEAERIWRESWEQTDEAAAGATLGAVGRMTAAFPGPNDPAGALLRRVLTMLAKDAVRPMSERLRVASTSDRPVSTVVPVDVEKRVVAQVVFDLEWVLVRGTPSPLRALLDVWMSGMWPMLLPGDVALIYVPIEHEGQLVPWLEGDPLHTLGGAPGLARRGPLRGPVPAERSTAPAAWWHLGISLPPSFVTLEGSSVRGSFLRVMPGRV